MSIILKVSAYQGCWKPQCNYSCQEIFFSHGDLKCKWVESRDLGQMRRDRDAISERLGNCIPTQCNGQVFSESLCTLVGRSLPYVHLPVSFVCLIEMARKGDKGIKFVFVRLLAER